MLVAHDLLLLLLDDKAGKITVGVAEPDKALAGAVLIDLAGRELVGVTSGGKKGRLVVHARQEPPEPLLRQGLAVIRGREGLKPQTVLGPLAKGLREQVAAELVASGLVRREPRKVLGLVPTIRFPAADPSYKAELRTRLAAVLAGTAEPDERTGPLIALLHALNVVTKVVAVEDRRAARRRAKEVADGDWAAAAVRRAVQDVQAAVMVAVMAGAAAASSGGS